MERSVESRQAMRIAMEDLDTIHFILANFSPADQRPEIFSFRWPSGDEQSSHWQIVLIERPPGALSRMVGMVNAAVLEVDSTAGMVLGRRFFKNLYGYELQAAIRRDLDIHREGCRGPRM